MLLLNSGKEENPQLGEYRRNLAQLYKSCNIVPIIHHFILIGLYMV